MPSEHISVTGFSLAGSGTPAATSVMDRTLGDKGELNAGVERSLWRNNDEMNIDKLRFYIRKCVNCVTLKERRNKFLSLSACL